MLILYLEGIKLCVAVDMSEDAARNRGIDNILNATTEAAAYWPARQFGCQCENDQELLKKLHVAGQHGLKITWHEYPSCEKAPKRLPKP